jgi:hypothetical protein
MAIRSAHHNYINPSEIDYEDIPSSPMDPHHDNTETRSSPGYQSQDSNETGLALCQSAPDDQSMELAYYNQQDEKEFYNEDHRQAVLAERRTVCEGKQRQIPPYYQQLQRADPPMSRRTAKRKWLAPNPNIQHPEVNYSGGQYDDPTENMEDYYEHLDRFLHTHEDPHYYDQPHAHIDELDNNKLPLDTDVIEDHNNEKDYYPMPNNDNSDYLDNRSHKYHTLDDIDKLDEDQYPENSNYYPNKTYEPNNDHSYLTPDDDEPQFPSIDSEHYWTPDDSLNSYHTVNNGPYEDLEDFCCIYCTGQHPDNWCPILHY